MNPRAKLAAFCATVLTACGGGGGGAQINLQFSPEVLTSAYYSGDAQSATVRVTASANVSGGSLYIYIVDGEGILSGTPSISRESGDEFQVYFDFSPSLAPGIHDGTLTIQACGTADCSTSYSVSPNVLPYSLNVTSSTNLTPLTPFQNAPEWVTYQGGASHSGYFPATLDSAVFTPRWIYRAPPRFEDTQKLTAATASEGLVYVASNVASITKDLIALRDSDGGVAWSGTIDWAYYGEVCPPAVHQGSVFLIDSSSPNADLIKVNAATGVQQAKGSFNSQSWSYNAPTGFGSKVYTAGASYGAMNQFNATTAEREWGNESGSDYQLSPAVDANYIYGFGGIGPNLERYDTSGELKSAILDTGAWTDGPYRDYKAPVLSDGSAYMVAPGHVTAFNLSNDSVMWTKPGQFTSNPTVANSVLYVTAMSPLRIEALSAVDGTHLWSWIPPVGTEYWLGDLIATDNLLFVSTNTQILALSLSTRETVWTYTRPGLMALSASGLLYITRYSSATQRSDGTLVAVNLR